MCSSLVCAYLDWLIGSGEGSSGYHNCVNCPRPSQRDSVKSINQDLGVSPVAYNTLQLVLDSLSY